MAPRYPFGGAGQSSSRFLADPADGRTFRAVPMEITRRYTVEGQDPFAAFTFVPRTSRIANPDGSVVFEMRDLLAPEGFSQGAVDILAQKYFRKAGVPLSAERVPEEGVPEWLQRSRPAAD